MKLYLDDLIVKKPIMTIQDSKVPGIGIELDINATLNRRMNF